MAVLRGLVEVLEAASVENARTKGWSWRQIAARVGDQAGGAQEVRQWAVQGPEVTAR